MCRLWSRHAACFVVSVVLVSGTLVGCAARPPATGSSPDPSLPPARASPDRTSLPLLSAEADVLRGQALFRGEEPFAGSITCASCHTFEPGARDSVGPNLAGIAVRAETRIAGMDAAAYIERSIRVHDEFLVPGFAGGLVRTLAGDEFTALLADEQVAALKAYLLTLTEPSEVTAPAGGRDPTGTLVAPAPSIRATLTVTAPVVVPLTVMPSMTTRATRTVTTTALPGSTATPAPLTATSLPTTVTPSMTTRATQTTTTTALPGSTATPAPLTATSLPTTAPPTATNVPTAAPPTTTSLPTAAPPTATSTSLPAPTPEPPTATSPPVPTPTVLLVPSEPPTATLPSLPDEANLGRYSGCVTCHAQHPLQVQMPHPLNPTCNTCHRGSPNQIGCLTCHSTHGIDNKHEPSPDLSCASCHT